MARIKHTNDLKTSQVNKHMTRWKKIHAIAKDLLEESDDIRAILRSHLQLNELTELQTALGVISLRTQTTTDWNAALKSLGLTDEKIAQLKEAHAKVSEPFVSAPLEWSKERKAQATKKRAA